MTNCEASGARVVRWPDRRSLLRKRSSRRRLGEGCAAAAQEPCRGAYSRLCSSASGGQSRGVTMVAFNDEISSADKIGLHLSEIGRIQNNAGSLMQFTAILFAVCVYFYNAMIWPASDHRMAYAIILSLNALFLVTACFLYLRCLTLSVGWSAKANRPKAKFHLLSTLSEEEIEDTLFHIVRSFRRGTYFFFISFFSTFVLLGMVAAGELTLSPL